MCANGELLNGLARARWNFTGYVVTDCNAFDAISSEHHYTPNVTASIPVAYAAGTDLYNCGALKNRDLVDFMSGSSANEELLTANLRRILRVQFELGLFDAPDQNPYSSLGPEDIDTAAHRAMAEDAALQSLVLLHNSGGAAFGLPIRHDRAGHIALIGPNANATTTMQGNYYTHKPPFLISPL